MAPAVAMPPAQLVGLEPAVSKPPAPKVGLEVAVPKPVAKPDPVPVKDAMEAGSNSVAGKAKFLEVYQLLKREILADCELITYDDESRAWVEEMVEHNVPGGKLNRGLSVVDSLKLLKKNEKISEKDVFRACVLGWCIEWLQGSVLVLDDIMDASITRRGQPCWYRLPKVGLIGINDAMVLRTHVTRILKTHFRKTPFEARLIDLFSDVEYQTAAGQMLDLITTPAGEVDLARYVMPTYVQIVKYKTAFYSFYLPVACALLLAGETNEKKFEAAKELLVEMGIYFQVQDDFLDCYGAPDVIGKIGTDIEDTKCSWLICQALLRANDAQKQILYENYGKKEQFRVERVKRLYNELELQKVFQDYEHDIYNKLCTDIDKQEDPALQAVFRSFLTKIYRRRK